jgi:outer membrane lipoprotein-sorting protein
MRPPFVALCLASWLSVTGAASAAVTDPALREILDGYVEQCGGRYPIQDLKSLRWEGDLSEDGAIVAEVVIVRKRPGKIRLMLQQGPRKLTLGYNGKTCWSAQSYNNQTAKATTLEPPVAANLIREADLIDALAGYRESSYTYTLIGEESLDGTDAYVIGVTRPGIQSTEAYYLSKDGLKLLQRVIKTSAPDSGAEELTVTVYHDFRTVNGVLLPYATTTLLPNGRRQDLQWETIDPNAGVFDYYFEPPK